MSETPIENPAPPLVMPDDTPTLSREQEARIEAAGAARSCLYSTGFASTKGPDVGDVIRLATWMVTGLDPWVGGEQIVADDNPRKAVWVDGHGIREVEDTLLPDGPNYEP